MSKAKMQAAKELIQAKQYDEARIILKTIDHPIAVKWLNRLDEIAPEWEQKLDNDDDVALEQKEKPVSLKGCLLFFLIVFGLCYFFTNSNSVFRNTSTTIDITDSGNTGIPNKYLNILNQTISAHGYVDFYEGIMSSQGRLLVDTEIWLTTQNSDYITAYYVLEKVLRSYAKEFPSNSAGKISARVYWRVNNVQCATGVGMGYRTQQRINWQTASWNRIVSALDQERYSDNTLDYGDIAWRPNITGTSVCR